MTSIIKGGGVCKPPYKKTEEGCGSSNKRQRGVGALIKGGGVWEF